MVMCQCVKCGGQDKNKVCDNDVLLLQSGVWRIDRLTNTLLFVSGIAVFISLIFFK